MKFYLLLRDALGFTASLHTKFEIYMDAEIERLTGITRERALRIDEVNIYERLGPQVFQKLSTAFYGLVFNDQQKWFRNIFNGSSLDEAIQNQMEFFMQRLGGPPLYSQRKGHPALIMRHLKFNMSLKATERWVEHMQNALAATLEIDEDSRVRMLDFFTHTAYFLHIGVTSRHKSK